VAQDKRLPRWATHGSCPGRSGKRSEFAAPHGAIRRP